MAQESLSPKEHRDNTPKQPLTLQERIHQHRGAGYGAMTGAVAGAMVLGPIGAMIGGAVGGGIGSVIDQKFRQPRPPDEQ